MTKTVYLAKSPIKIMHNSGSMGDIDSYMLNNDGSTDDITSLVTAVEEDMKELGPRGLAKYLSKPLEEIIESIVITIENGFAYAIIKSNKELSDDEVKAIEKYMTGQYSDGWGEGFEQREIYKYLDTLTDFDEEEGEEFSYEEDIYVYASFYNSKNFFINVSKI